MTYELYQIENTGCYGLISTIAMYVVMVHNEQKMREYMASIVNNPQEWFDDPIKISIKEWNLFAQELSNIHKKEVIA